MSDLLAGAIYVATILAIVNFAFAVPIGGLLATSVLSPSFWPGLQKHVVGRGSPYRS